jgi:hypothetical protein
MEERKRFTSSFVQGGQPALAFSGHVAELKPNPLHSVSEFTGSDLERDGS